MHILIIVILSAVIIAGVIGIILWNRKKSLPIREMVQTLKQLARGDANLTLRLQPDGAGDIDRLKSQINAFVMYLDRMMYLIQSGTDYTEKNAETLYQFIEKLHTNVADIAEPITEVKSLVLTQSNDTGNVFEHFRY